MLSRDERTGRPWSARAASARAEPAPPFLRLLCVLLLIWQPISLALVASTMLGRLPTRGVPLALLLLTRLVAAGFGIAAGLALARRRSGAVALAKASLVLTAIVDVIVYVTPYFPTNLLPGDAPLYAA